MPMIITTDEKPTYVEKPDMRFAATFLSYKYRDYAVIGESLQDKATGEIYTKRADGRTVSFFQNKKIYEDLCLKARVMLNNNTDFKWPSDDAQSYFCGVNYDCLSFFSEKRLDILTTDLVFPNEEDDLRTQFRFNITPLSNGFFINPCPRDPDKPAIEFLTAKYNQFFENYDGSDPAFALEKAKFDSNPKWKYSNATIHYTVTVTDGTTTKVYTCEDWIRVSELRCVLIPYVKIGQDFPDGYTNIRITIRGIEFYKIHFMVDHLLDFDEEFQKAYKNFLYPDQEMYVDWIEVYTFVDDPYNLLFLGNEFVVALLDVPYFKQYLAKMGTLIQGGGLIMSIDKPDDGIWTANVGWGERKSDVYRGGIKIDHEDSTTDIRKTEAILAGVEYISGNLNNDPVAFNDFYLVDTSVGTYTREQIDAMVENVVNTAISKKDKIVVRAERDDVLKPALEEVTDKGLVLGTVYTTESEDDESEGE